MAGRIFRGTAAQWPTPAHLFAIYRAADNLAKMTGPNAPPGVEQAGDERWYVCYQARIFQLVATLKGEVDRVGGEFVGLSVEGWGMDVGIGVSRIASALDRVLGSAGIAGLAAGSAIEFPGAGATIGMVPKDAAWAEGRPASVARATGGVFVPEDQHAGIAWGVEKLELALASRYRSPSDIPGVDLPRPVELGDGEGLAEVLGRPQPRMSPKQFRAVEILLDHYPSKVKLSVLESRGVPSAHVRLKELIELPHSDWHLVIVKPGSHARDGYGLAWPPFDRGLPSPRPTEDRQKPT